MPATSFKNLTIANVDALITYLDGIFTGAGWTQVAVMNSTAGRPTNFSYLGREIVYQISGTAASPTRAFVTMFRQNVNGAPDTIGFAGATAIKGPVTIATISSGTFPNFSTITVTTTTPHGFATDDLLWLNGTSNQLFHTGCQPSSPAHTIIVDDATTFHYIDASIGSTISATGGVAMAVYNMAGTRGQGGGQYWSGQDNTLQVFGAIDEFRCVFVVKQAANTRFIMLGCTGRRHIPAAFSDTAFTTGSITGPGAVTINLDRASPNLCAAQYAWLIDSQSGLFERFPLTSVLGPTSVQATLTKTGTYAAGALFGDDPCPLAIVGGQNNGAITTNDLTQYVAKCSFFTDGTRTDASNNQGASQTYTPTANTGVGANVAGNDGTGYDQGAPLILRRNFPDHLGIRANLGGTSTDLVVLFGINSQVDDDFEQTGCSVPATNYAIFSSQPIGTTAGGGNYCVAIGPGAT